MRWSAIPLSSSRRKLACLTLARHPDIPKKTNPKLHLPTCKAKHHRHHHQQPATTRNKSAQTSSLFGSERTAAAPTLRLLPWEPLLLSRKDHHISPKLGLTSAGVCLREGGPVGEGGVVAVHPHCMPFAPPKKVNKETSSGKLRGSLGHAMFGRPVLSLVFVLLPPE